MIGFKRERSQKMEERLMIEEKLKAYEKIKNVEEELGIDLITIFKALKNGFYYRKEGAIVHISKDDLLLRSGAIHFAGKGLIFAGLFLPFKDYGKTWALTKEELKNESNND